LTDSINWWKMPCSMKLNINFSTPIPAHFRILALVASLIIALLFSLPPVTQAQSSSYLDQFYADEIDRFNRAIEKHIKQVDKCINEMDRFEKGEVFLDPVECPKLNRMLDEVLALIGNVKIVLTSYQASLIREIKKGVSEDNFPKTEAPMSRSASLMRVYSVKIQQAQLQSKRVQKLEGDLVKKFKSVWKKLQEFGDSQFKKEDEVKPKPKQ